MELPTLPLRPSGDPTRRTSLHADNVRLLKRSEHSEENNPYFRDYRPIVAAEAATNTAIAAHEMGSLTLIRRDPASNEQWNVATIHDPPVQEVSSTTLLTPGAARRTKKGGAPVYLDITNTGYRHFIDSDSRSDSRTSTSTSNSSDSEPPPEGTFRRRLYMPGSRFADHSYGHRKLKSLDDSASRDDEMRRSMRQRTLSDLTASIDKRSKSYSFTSPWDGHCEFSTGAAGKSLKCRHTLNRQQQGSTVEVSELRFNLPTSTTRSTPTPMQNGDKRSSYFSHLRTDSWDGSSTPGLVLDDQGRLDLSLGQERAGGGFGGKQAKLGKLIIEPEGLRMLDLLVAANVGLWWRAYERG